MPGCSSSLESFASSWGFMLALNSALIPGHDYLFSMILTGRNIGEDSINKKVNLAKNRVNFPIDQSNHT